MNNKYSITTLISVNKHMCMCTCDTNDTQSHLDASTQVMSSYWHKHGFEKSTAHNEPHYLNIIEDKNAVYVMYSTGIII